MSEWQPIEAAPYDRLVLLAVVGDAERRVFVAQEDNKGWLITTDWMGWTRLHGGWTPAHWMPLPDAPC